MESARVLSSVPEALVIGLPFLTIFAYFLFFDFFVLDARFGFTDVAICLSMLPLNSLWRPEILVIGLPFLTIDVSYLLLGFCGLRRGKSAITVAASRLTSRFFECMSRAARLTCAAVGLRGLFAIYPSPRNA
jgi:hypothetical protein